MRNKLKIAVITLAIITNILSTVKDSKADASSIFWQEQTIILNKLLDKKFNSDIYIINQCVSYFSNNISCIFEIKEEALNKLLQEQEKQKQE